MMKRKGGLTNRVRVAALRRKSAAGKTLTSSEEMPTPTPPSTSRESAEQPEQQPASCVSAVSTMKCPGVLNWNIAPDPKLSEKVENVLTSFIDNLTITTKELLNLEYMTVLAINPNPSECILSQQYPKKFRFKEIPCIKDTRVALPKSDREGSDFIHANRIVIDTLRSYIATQLPLENAYDDFWKMILNDKCGVIVLLGTEHSEKFFPTEVYAQQKHGKISVKVIKRAKRDSHTLLMLELQSDASSDCFYTTLIHDIKWAVDKVPSSTGDIIKICKLLRNYSESAMAVVCDSGAGRSGTFVCIDAVIHRLHQGKEVRILPIVCDVRSLRACSVYSLEQYLFIYSTVCDYFLPRVDSKRAKQIEAFKNTIKSV